MEENLQEVQETPVVEEQAENAPEVAVEPEVVTDPAPAVFNPTGKVGDRVRIFIDPPGGEITLGTVRVVQDVPGKQVGVELDQFTDRCHSLDGVVEERVDETRGVVVGRGWWTREDNLEVVQ